jgi:holin-like protein
VLISMAAIVSFEVAGDICQRALGLPIPGPVIGMALLLLALILRGQLPDGLERTATGLLSYLPMLFVPAGVGIMAHFKLIRAEWPALAAGLVGSSVLAIVATALTMRAVERAQKAIRGAQSERILSQPKVTYEPDLQ